MSPAQRPKERNSNFTMTTEYNEFKICGKFDILNQLNYLRWITRMRPITSPQHSDYKLSSVKNLALHLAMVHELQKHTDHGSKRMDA